MSGDVSRRVLLLVFGEGPLSCCLEGSICGELTGIICGLCITSPCQLVGHSVFANPCRFGSHCIGGSLPGTAPLEFYFSEESIHYCCSFILNCFLEDMKKKIPKAKTNLSSMGVDLNKVLSGIQHLFRIFFFFKSQKN